MFWFKSHGLDPNKKNKKTIMIVEDSEDLVEMYRMKLEKVWFNVLVETNWFEALDKLANKTPELILLDIMMPGMDWFEVLEKIRNDLKITSKIIVFSNLDGIKNQQKAISLWADGFILKASITPSELIEKINKILL